NPYYLTNIKLRQLYCRFGHPLVKRLTQILKCLGHDINSKTLDYLTRYYYYY
ncbi:uncharacterized protein K441DRAFT_550795, partial [Cenococcum geophilum 1.58]|uniref:uncharacterized protein n=1 Tax=Cenococcum geophilum 1.58 TaxID=794803 RepID=UPI00358FF524